MRTQLILTAAETVALENTLPDQHHPLLPVKTAHAFPAGLSPHQNVKLSGRKVMTVYGTGEWMSFSGVTLPFERRQVLQVIELVTAKTRSPLARALRDTWVNGGQAGRVPVSQVRRSRPEYTRLSVHLGECSLKRVQALSEIEIMRLGLRRTEAGFTFRDTATSFGTAQLALADHWDTHNPLLPYHENPWCWLVQLDLPTAHVGEAETLRQAEDLTRQLRKEDGMIDGLHAQLHARNAVRRGLETQLVRLLQARTDTEHLTVGGYRVSFHCEQARRVKETA